MLSKCVAGGILALVAVSAASGQDTLVRRPATPIPSMGQPPKWEPYAVPAALRAQPNVWTGMLTAGIHKPITNPVTGIFGLAGEGYAVGDGRLDFDYGARVLATSRALGLSAGVDWFAPGNEFDGVLSFQTAIRRGGLIDGGTMLRIDYLPGRNHALSFGIWKQFGNPWLGRTRPFDTDVDPPPSPRISLPPDGVPADAEVPLRRVGSAAAMILAYTNLFGEDTSQIRYGQSHTSATALYDTALVQAFRVAAGGVDAGNRVTSRARTGLLDHVIIPFDSLFGQVKENQTSIRPFTAAAQAQFASWLGDSSGIDRARHSAIIGVHARWMSIVEAVHKQLLAQWRDSRLVWLPLQLALTPDQYDEQAEVDLLIERAVGRPFTDQNALTYLRSVDLPLEIARSIIATRDYHVLWTHDMAGRRDKTKELDEIAFSMVADAYLPALTQAVQRYDSLRHFPLYMIMIDQFFYASRNGRLWMDILSDPLGSPMKLPGANAAREERLRERQRELREAVAKSWRLQQDATANGGERFLHKAVKVHVNVVLPSDFSFRSHHTIPPFPFVPDNIMRDHRKTVFYDLNERDPYAGALMVMGVGIGEHYASATWEDRGYRVRGPATLEARAALRRALLGMGWKASDIPPALREVESKELVEDAADRRDYIGRALQVHNEAGFGAKESSVARAMLYNLAPPGSVLIVPDPIWVSETWAAMLAGAAARGAKVYIISPSKENTPNPQATLAVAQYDVMKRLIEIRDRIGPHMRLSGGELRIGLFSGKAPINDVAGRLAEIRAGLAAEPWIRQVIPFNDRTLATLDRAVVSTEADGQDATRIADDEAPRAPLLHQKTQLIARPGAIASLVSRPGWDAVLARAMQSQSQQTAKFADQLGWTTPEVDSLATRDTDEVFSGYEAALPESERKAVSFYFSLGSQNQDPRGIMLDGESTVVVSGLHAAAGLVDLFYMMARTSWLDDTAELDRLRPRPGGLAALIARMIKLAL